MPYKKCVGYKSCTQTILVEENPHSIHMPTAASIIPNYKGVMICRSCRNDPRILKTARLLQASHKGFEWMKTMRNEEFDG